MIIKSLVIFVIMKGSFYQGSASLFSDGKIKMNDKEMQLPHCMDVSYAVCMDYIAPIDWSDHILVPGFDISLPLCLLTIAHGKQGKNLVGSHFSNLNCPINYNNPIMARPIGCVIESLKLWIADNESFGIE